MKILLLEDDYVLGESIQEMLIEVNYEVDWVMDGMEAANATYEGQYDLYIFDVNVPSINGFDLLEDLRSADDHTPTIYISAMTDIAAIAKGFSIGAQDYIKKPFYPEELLVRVEAKFALKNRVYSLGKISFNPLTNEVKKENRIISLGEVQLPLLKLFIMNLGRTLRKEELFDLMEYPSETALRVAINKLKSTTDWKIENIRGIGYRIEKS